MEEQLDQWLVRTAQNVVSGPYTKDQVCELVKSGKLFAQDEVCPANGYWIFLYETEEVQKQLGIEVPRLATSRDEDITKTETQTETETDNHYRPGEGQAEEEMPVPELSEPTDAQSDSTVMLRNRALREFQPKKKGNGSVRAPGAFSGVGGGGNDRYRPVILGKIEKTSFWRGFAWALILVIVILVSAVLKLLNHP